MNVLKEYQSLYKDDYFIMDCYGGRAGARSYSITQLALYHLLHKVDYRGFFLRQTNATIYTSMWADFKDRINEYQDMHQKDLSTIIEYTDNKHGENTAINKISKGSITTKGFQVSSGNNTANLKSLAGATNLYIDEFDEVQKKDFNKLKLSLRKKGVKIQIVRAFNPPNIKHTVWEDYNLYQINDTDLLEMVCKHSMLDFKILEDYVKNNTRTFYKAIPKHENHKAIFSTFANNYKNLNETAILEYDKILVNDFFEYCKTILGLIPTSSGEVVYSDYDLMLNNTDRLPKEGETLHIGMDFNITQMSAVVHVVEDNIPYAVDEFTGVYDTFQMIRVIKDKYPNWNIVIYPDASGNARNTSGESDHNLLRQAGFKVFAPKKNPNVKDRVTTMNMMFRKGYKVNSKQCPEYSQALMQLAYKNGEPDKGSGLDHVTDGGGYYIHFTFQQRNAKVYL